MFTNSPDAGAYWQKLKQRLAAESTDRGELVVCATEDGNARFFLRAEGGTAWLTQAGIAAWFQRPPRPRQLYSAPCLSGASWRKAVCPDAMSIVGKPVRQSVSLPARVARQVKLLAQTSKTSTSRVIANLIESGLDAREQEKKIFLNSPTASRAPATRRNRNVSRKNSLA